MTNGCTSQVIGLLESPLQNLQQLFQPTYEAPLDIDEIVPLTGVRIDEISHQRAITNLYTHVNTL